MSRTANELRSIRDSISLIGRLSDSLIKIGPFSLGIDGVLSWIPAVGEAYSFGAGALILVQGARAGVAPSILVKAAVILALRTFSDVLPIAGPVFADFFTAHKWAAGMMVEAIDRMLGDAPPKPRQPMWRRAPVVA
jgi:hypothetical protein